MVSITALWLPILLSAILVFIASSVIHMVLKYHNSDFNKLPKEDEIMESLRKHNIQPGVYAMPHAGSMEAYKSEEFIEKSKKGPVAFITVSESGPQAMGKSLTLWFIFSLVIGIFAAYVTGRALEPGAHYLAVFRFVGVTAFLGYGMAIVQNSIWYKHSWSISIKFMFDSLIYALLTAGVFGWLWPQ